MVELHNLLHEFDVYFYAGTVSFQGHTLLTDLVECKAQRKRKAYFLPVTVGGSPDAGFRIARALGHYYPEGVTCMVLDVCKSAGTLITIGANELVISNRGELGPLDIQLQKKEEIFEMSSGLDIIKALQILQETTQKAFKDYLVDLRKFGLGTKLSAEIASKMATNLVAPIAGQIDPAKLGEHQRALKIASEYGRRLNAKFQNTVDENIDSLLIKYPAHGFVIDRKEAAQLFSRVRDLNEGERELEDFLRSKIPSIGGLADGIMPFVIDLGTEISAMLEAEDVTEEGSDYEFTSDRESDADSE